MCDYDDDDDDAAVAAALYFLRAHFLFFAFHSLSNVKEMRFNANAMQRIVLILAPEMQLICMWNHSVKMDIVIFDFQFI